MSCQPACRLAVVLILCYVSSNYYNADAALDTHPQSHGAADTAFGRVRLSLADDVGVARPASRVAKRSSGSKDQSTAEGDDPGSNTNQQDLIHPVADFILQVVRSQIVKRGKQQVKIPDIHKTKYKGVAPFGMAVHFDATEGWFRDLSSMKRVGKVNVSRLGNDVIMEFGVGLETMMFGYDKYTLKVGPMSASGHISGDIGNSSIIVKFSMDVSGQSCSISLLDIKVVLLGEVKVRATGMGWLNVMYSKVVSAVTNKYRNEAMPKVERTLRKNIQQLTERLRCEDNYGNF